MGFGTSPGHRNATYDDDTDGDIDSLDPDAAQEQALAVDFVVGSL